ncbi:MAG: hypothetical protein ACOYD0_11995 [Candidatus Nanopelagicales bacterium]
MSVPGSSSAQFCGQCGTSADATQRYCRSCGAELGVGPDRDTRATTSMNGGSDAPPAAADRAGFPRWGWAALAAAVAVAVAAVGGFALVMTQSSDGGSPLAAGSSSAPPSTALSASATPQTSSPTTSPAPAALAIPVGWTLWKSKDRNAIAVHRIGNTVQIGNPDSPCFTGESTGTSTYRGGGLNQGGTYSKQTWTVKMLDPTHLSTSNGDYAVTWKFVNGDGVNTVYGPVTLTDLQQGC